MSPKLRRIFSQYNISTWKNFSLRHTLALIWIDVRYSVEEWVLLRTWKFRAKHSKRLQLSSLAYYNEGKMSWDDVEVADQWGLWLPIGFGLVSKANWDFDQHINRDIGQPEDEWKDFVDGDWPTYYYKDDFLNSNHYFDAARKHFKRKLSDVAYNKDITLRLCVVSQESIDEETKRWMDWVADGSKPFKIQFTDKAKDDLSGILGEDEAKDLFNEIDEKNKRIENTEQNNDIDESQK